MIVANENKKTKKVKVDIFTALNEVFKKEFTVFIRFLSDKRRELFRTCLGFVDRN